MYLLAQNEDCSREYVFGDYLSVSSVMTEFVIPVKMIELAQCEDYFNEYSALSYISLLNHITRPTTSISFIFEKSQSGYSLLSEIPINFLSG